MRKCGRCGAVGSANWFECDQCGEPTYPINRISMEGNDVGDKLIINPSITLADIMKNIQDKHNPEYEQGVMDVLFALTNDIDDLSDFDMESVLSEIVHKNGGVK